MEKIKLGLPFSVPDLVYKFQMICLGELKLLTRNQIWDVQMAVWT
jgi:hypothetical protein